MKRVRFIEFLNRIPSRLLIVISLFFILSNISFLFIPNIRELGESTISQFQYKMNFGGVLVSTISLLAATWAIIIALDKPKMEVYFINEHGIILTEKSKGYPLTLGMDQNGLLDYQSCVPSDWNIIIVNCGNKVAESITIKLWLDGVAFDQTLDGIDFELEKFIYGHGLFERISYSLARNLRQGESTKLPRIPFNYSVTESESLKNKGYTNLYMQIFCNNQKPTLITKRIKIEDADIGDYNHDVLSENIPCIAIDILNEIKETNNLTIDIYHNVESMDPYVCEIYKDTKSTKKLYDYYKKRNLEEMMFWGRMYYRALGMRPRDIEAILQNEIMIMLVKDEGKIHNSI